MTIRVDGYFWVFFVIDELKVDKIIIFLNKDYILIIDLLVVV